MTIKEAVMRSITYIESHLHETIGVCDVANAVSYSQFYFSREFSKYTHSSIYDYILRRKITESYKELFQSDSRIIDLALKYGFQSHEVYTRAFRKIFGENPSEVARYKPLALFEPIDEEFLDFLAGLRIELIDQVVEDCHFEVASFDAPEEQTSLLVELSKENYFHCEHIINGNTINNKTKYLSFALTTLKCKYRIYHTDLTQSLRYFYNYFYQPEEMSSNYILLKKTAEYIDIIIPSILSPDR